MLNVVQGGRKAALSRQAETFFFERNPDITSINITGAPRSLGKSKSSIISNRFFISNETDVSALDEFFSANEIAIERSCAGETIALNASPYFNMAAMALLFSWKENGLDETCIITFSIESISIFWEHLQQTQLLL